MHIYCSFWRIRLHQGSEIRSLGFLKSKKKPTSTCSVEFGGFNKAPKFEQLIQKILSLIIVDFGGFLNQWSEFRNRTEFSFHSKLIENV